MDPVILEPMLPVCANGRSAFARSVRRGLRPGVGGVVQDKEGERVSRGNEAFSAVVGAGVDLRMGDVCRKESWRKGMLGNEISEPSLPVDCQ
jgi:hypothetical protein